MNPLTEYFSFSKSERIAIITILLAIVCILMLPSIYIQLKQPIPEIDPGFEKEIAQFLSDAESNSEASGIDFDYSNPDKEIVRRSITPFSFDPNTLDMEGWVRMGFTEKQAAGILRYREKGGKFNKKEDVKKLYVVTDEIFNLIEPFIAIEKSKSGKEQANFGEVKKEYAPRNHQPKYQVELNSADSAELVKVYGIGPAIAKRILRYREKLGGFAFTEQLREVYGIDSARFETIRAGVMVDAEVVVKIDVNSSSITQLRQHPYIDYYIAKAIVDNRIKKGAYTSVNELAEIPLIYDALFRKLSPYISVNQIK